MSSKIPSFVTLAEGGRVTVNLRDGVTIGNVSFTTAYVCQLKAGDILDAQEEAERLVYTNEGGMALVMSPARMARASLRRQVARLAVQDMDKIVEHHGPLSAEELNLFSVEDLERLQTAATLLDNAAAMVTGGMDARGRSAAGSGTAPAAVGPVDPQNGDAGGGSAPAAPFAHA